MSDPQSSYGEPVDEPTNVDDVVDRANEGLADAEAASRDAVQDSAGASDEPDSAAVAAEPAGTDPAPEPAAPEPAAEAAATGEPVAEPDPWDSPEAAALEYESAPPIAEATPEPVVPAADPVVAEPAAGSATAVVEPATTVTGSETSSEAATVSYGAGLAAAAAPQPIFVQAPEAPRPRGNRAAAGAIGLLAAVAFAVLYLGAWLGFSAIAGQVADVADAIVVVLRQWAFWTPVVVFFIAFWLLGAIINRGRWGAWVVFGLLVGFAAYGGFVLGQLFQAPFWMLTPTEGTGLVQASLLTPMSIAAFVIGRELTIWFGAWVAARGKRVTELNVEAQREYERTLEAGPQLVRQ